MNKINAHKSFLSPAWAVLALIMLLSSAVFAQQSHFETADQAADAFVIAVATNDEAALTGLLGEGYRDVLPVEELDAEQLQRFVDAWIHYHSLVSNDVKTRMLAVGVNGWTLPIPIVKDAEGWRFDLVEGEEVMRLRRVGRNELAVMQALLAYHDAQMEYAEQDRDGDGVLEYAQRFISTPGERNGLYWEVEPGQQQSPLGPLFADEKRQQAYHGYHYRILTAQGKHAPGGARDYLQNGHMTGGFAIIAWPAEYGETGVMSFMLGREGVIYESDLGPAGKQVASSMTAFDPDSRWSRVDEVAEEDASLLR
jgi:hypothetical protein